MAEGGTSQSGTSSHTNAPITDSDRARVTQDGKTLISFESFENSDMLSDFRGWLTESKTGERFWCVAASKTLGLFESPESDEPRMVLTLTDFQMEASIKDVDSSENFNSQECASNNGSISSDYLPRKKEYVLELKTNFGRESHYSFIVPTEREFLLWRQTLQEVVVQQKKTSFDECRRMDSGLGEDLESLPSAQRKDSDLSADVSKLLKKRKVASDTTSRDEEWESRTENLQSRGSSFMSSNDDLADSRSMSDSASGDNNSTINLSEMDFADSETNSYGRHSLNDSVFLGASQEWESSVWNESKDADSIIGDADSAPNSRPPTLSSMSSAGDVTEGPRSDHNKTVISKVSKLAQRVGLIRRPRVSSGLTLGHLPDTKISGPMRKKGKVRWYALSGSYMYRFKTNSPEAEAETICDLASYSATLATEEKEDGQSIGLLKLTHSSGKKVLFSIKSIDTAELWLSYIEDAIRSTVTTKESRSDSQKSNSSNPDSQRVTQSSVSSRLSRESFEESYGYFERQSSLRAERDAVHNAIAEVARPGTQDCNSGSSGTADDRHESRSLSDFESIAPSATTWESSDDLDLGKKKTSPALQSVKRSIRSSLKQNVQQMPIPASEVVDPTLTGHLHVYAQSKQAWKKSWAVLKDDWLYFYKKPTDTSTTDIIVLPKCTVQRERTLGDSTPLTRHKLMFSISHKDGSNRTILMGESEKETRAWMDKMRLRAKRQSTTLDGLNLESGSSSRQLLPSESGEQWHKNQADHHKQKLLMEVLQQNQGSQDLPESPSESVDPGLAKKKAEIITKYQKANNEEEEDLVRMMTILNRRRMSAQVKKDALQRTIGNKTKRRVERIGSVEESTMEDQIRILNARLGSISTEINAKSMQKTNRLQALKEKKELELQLLEQQERLSRYRRLAQDALQGTLAGLDEESLGDATGSSEEGMDSQSRESLQELSVDRADETDSNSKETQSEIMKQRLSPSLQTNAADKSPNSRLRRRLPILPNKGEKPSPVSDMQQGTEEKSQLGNTPVDDNPLQHDASHTSTTPDGLPVKKSSPLRRLRKISLGAKSTVDTSQSTKEPRYRKQSQGIQSFDEGFGTNAEERRPSLKQYASSTSLGVAAKVSPITRRATDNDLSPAGSASPQRPRRKISVPIRMPSMENLFTSSSSKSNKEKKRKTSVSNAPILNKGAMPKTLTRSDGFHYHPGQANTRLSPNSSPDINGNVPSVGRGQDESSVCKGHAVRDEIDPEVLRDIEEFEMMARKALQEDGWIFRS